MGVYIKDMKMPTTCEECRYFIKGMNHISLDYKYVCINGASALVFPNVYENRAFDCPLIEVPEPHGRLIDANGLVGELESDIAFINEQLKEYRLKPHNFVDDFDKKIKVVKNKLLDEISIIEAAPTVIKGSE